MVLPSNHTQELASCLPLGTSPLFPFLPFYLLLSLVEFWALPSLLSLVSPEQEQSWTRTKDSRIAQTESLTPIKWHQRLQGKDKATSQKKPDLGEQEVTGSDSP
jgi:hypothetical protein